MTYRPFLYNEKEQALEIYTNGFSRKEYDFRELMLVAKHLRHTLGYKDARIKRELIGFCREHDSNFNVFSEMDSIKSIVRHSKRPFVVKGGVSVTEKELIAVRSVPSFKAQKFLLGLLIFAKRDNGYVSSKKWADIKRIMFLNSTTAEIYEHLRVANEKKMIRPTRNTRYGSSVKVLFMDEDSSSKEKISINTNEKFNRSGQLYEKYCGGSLGYCTECGAEFVKSSNRQRYCSEHGKPHIRKRRQRGKR